MKSKMAKIILASAICAVIIATGTTVGILAASGNNEITTVNIPEAVSSTVAVNSEYQADTAETNDTNAEETTNPNEDETNTVTEEREEKSEDSGIDEFADNVTEYEASPIDSPLFSTQLSFEEANPWYNEYVPTAPAPILTDAIKDEIETTAVNMKEDNPFIDTNRTMEKSDVVIQRFCGVYNGYIVSHTDFCTVRLCAYTQRKIGDVFFFYGDSMQMNAIKDGKIYTLDYLYENNLISDTDLKDICYYFKNNK